MTLPLLLSAVYYRYCRSGPSSTGYRNIRTSEDVLLLHRYGLLRFGGGSQGSLAWDPPLDLPCCCAGRPQKFHRKVPGRSQQESADDGPAGVIKIFKNVVLAHYLDY